jgi:hypothetical protein
MKRRIVLALLASMSLVGTTAVAAPAVVAAETNAEHVMKNCFRLRLRRLPRARTATPGCSKKRRNRRTGQ